MFENRSLRKAAGRGNFEGVVEALENGAEIDARNLDGDTALLLAIGRGHIEIVRFLIEKGANLDLKAGGGNTALLYAVRWGKKEIARLLIESGANPDIRNDRGEAVLPDAVSSKYKDIVYLLIEKGADLEIRDRTGRTALTLAFQQKDRQLMQRLVAAGADTTRLSDAEQARYPEIFGLELPETVALPDVDLATGDGAWQKVTAQIICKYEGEIDGVGELRQIFNFGNQTVTQVIDKTPGPPCLFQQFEESQDDILRAYQELCARGGKPPQPFHQKRKIFKAEVAPG